MASTNTADILKALLTNIKSVLNGTDDSRPNPNNDGTFFSWMTPAMVFNPEDFSFTSKGLNPMLTANELKLMYEYCVLTNSIPKIGPVFNTDGARLDTTFKAILNQNSEVTNSKLLDDQISNLEKYRKLLSSKVIETVNEDTGEKETKTIPSPYMAKYNLTRDAYEVALNKYSELREAALKDIGGAAEKFSTLGKIYKKKVDDAYSAWVTEGRKEEVDEMNGYINQVTQKSLVIWKKHMQDQLGICDKTDAASGDQYCWTSLLPSGFAKNADRWQQINFGQSEYEKTEHKSSDSWGASGGVNWGLWSASANSTGTKTSIKEAESVSEYHISFGVTQVMINRPWFDVSFLKSKLWRSKNGDQPDGYVSDGNGKGIIPAYATFAVFINNLNILMKNSDTNFEASSLVTSSDASVGWGPFKIKGNYSNERSDKSLKSSGSDAGISIPGMQLIGFKCNMVDFVSPNTDKSLPKDTTWA